MYYYNARYYDPLLGSFLSPDTLVPDPGNVQAYNRYMYVLGNPLRYNDPTGHACDEDVGGELVPPADCSGSGGLIFTSVAEVSEDGGGGKVGGPGEGGGFWNTLKSWFGFGEEAPPVEANSAVVTNHADESPLEGESASGLKGLEPCSFSRETPVTTQDGPKPIGAVKTGDMVLAYNAALGKTGFYTVTATMSHVDPVVVILTLDGEQIHTTPEHPFYTASGTWVTASDLHPGDRIRQATGGNGVVQASEVVQRPQMMYDLTVAQAHTFFVGDQQWLVHNNCETTKRPSGWRKLVSKAMGDKSPRDSDGDMICPACGQKMDKPSPDHYPTVAERRATRTYNTRQEFLDDYYNPDELRPICHTCNISHRWENTPTDQLPHWPKPLDAE